MDNLAGRDQHLCILDLINKTASYGGPLAHAVAGSHF